MNAFVKSALIGAGVLGGITLISGFDSSANPEVLPPRSEDTSSVSDYTVNYDNKTVNSPSVELEPKCHPSYGECLNPDASDYDCSGGSGNGPYYTGIVKVIGPDVFGLDRDGDGWGCE